MSSAFKSLVVTLAALLAFWAGSRVPNPFVSSAVMGIIYSPETLFSGSRSSFGPFVLGLAPALSGFFLVELFSFFLPPLSRWRRQGFAGRTKLNRAALALTLFLAVITATFIVQQTSAAHPGQPPFLDDDPLSKLGAGLFYLGGFAILFFGGSFLTERGLGNGFGLFLFWGALTRLGEAFAFQYVTTGAPGGPALPPLLRLAPLLLSAVFVAFLFFWLSRRRALEAKHAGRAVFLEVPTLVQALFAWSLAWQLTGLLGSLGPVLELKYGITLNHSSAFERYGTFLAIFAASCAFLFFVAFSPRRLRNNTFGRVELGAGQAGRLRRLGLGAFAGVALYELFVHLPHPLAAGETVISRAFDFGALAAVFVLGLDIWQNFRFLQRVPAPACLGEFDNIHFLTLLKAEAEAAGHPVYLKGFEYRRLLAFFQPLQKVKVYVAPEHAETLRERLGLGAGSGAGVGSGVGGGAGGVPVV